MNRHATQATVYRQRQEHRDRTLDTLAVAGLVCWVMLMVAWVN